MCGVGDTPVVEQGRVGPGSASRPATNVGILPPMDDQLFPAGTVIDGRYRILRPLGQGGFARVYEAEHLQLERRAALKILNYVAEPGDTFYRRFVREAKIAANLDHPNVVTIFDFGVVEGRNLPYIAMEALSGRDLHDEIREHGPMTPARALPLFEGALDAIGLGHERGIIHKDLKPSNLFLVQPGTPQERMVVVDYGIARLDNDPEGQLTKTGAMSGTPAYLAPEYFHNQSVTPALDVYQLGLILAETLTGRRVVNAATPVAIAVAHTSGQHDIDARLRASPLGPLIEKALKVDPSERFPNAHAMLRALQQIEPPGPEVSFAVVDDAEVPKSHTPEAFAETAHGLPGATPPTPRGATPSDPLPDPLPGAPAPGPPSGPASGTAAGTVAGTVAGTGAGPTEAKKASSTKLIILAGIGILLIGAVTLLALVAMLMTLSDDGDVIGDVLDDVVGVDEVHQGAVAPNGTGLKPSDLEVSLAPGTSELNQKLYGYTYAHASLFIVPYMMGFYESFKANFGLESGDTVMVPPDLGVVVDMALDQIENGIGARPVRRKVDGAAKRYLATFRELRPVLEDADTYYNQRRGFEEDGMAKGRELDGRIMERWPKFRAAEREFTGLLYRSWIAHQDDLINRYTTTGSHPVRLKAARLIKAGAELMIEARTSPASKSYRKRLKAYDILVDDYKKYVRSNDTKLEDKFGMLDPHKGLVAPAKSLSDHGHSFPKSRASAEELAKRTDKKANPVSDIQFMTQAFHQMVSQQNQILRNL